MIKMKILAMNIKEIFMQNREKIIFILMFVSVVKTTEWVHMGYKVESISLSIWNTKLKKTFKNVEFR